MKQCTMCSANDKNSIIIKNKDVGFLCSRCYQRHRRMKVVHELPGYGEIKCDDDGKPICHICGEAYSKVLAHAWQVHEITAYDYKKEFGLDTTVGILSEDSRKIARVRNKENYDKVVVENLLVKGEDTRFVKGYAGRTKEQVSEQTRRTLKQNFKRKTREEDTSE